MDATPELLQLTAEAAANAGVPFELLAGLVQTESAWNPNAVSGAGAMGLTQVMPWWLTSSMFASYGLTRESLLDPVTNLWMGATILASELKRFGGSWELAAMAYNGGSPMVERAIKAAGSKDPEKVSNAIMAAETRAYWKKVLKWAQNFEGKASELEAKATEIVEDTKAFVSDSGPVLLFALGMMALGIMGARRG